MKIQKILFTLIMFLTVLGSASFAAGITITPGTTSNSTVQANSGVRFVIESPTQYLTEVGFELYYKNTGMLRSSGKMATGNVTKFTYDINPLSSVNGDYKLVIKAKTAYTQNSGVYYYTVTGGKTNVMSTSASVSSGSTVKPGSSVVINLNTGLNNVHMYSVGYQATPTWSGVNKETIKTTGIYTYNYTFIMPTTPGTYNIAVACKDGFGKTESKVYTYIVSNNAADNNNNNNNTNETKISIYSSVADGSTIAPEKEITFTAGSNNTDMVSIKVTVDGETEEVTSNGTDEISIKVEMPEEDDDYSVKVVAEDNKGNKQTKTFTFTVDSDNNDDPAEGVIGKELEDLVVDLWRTSTSRFYEVDDEIEFVAYYYNAESKSKKDVVIEVEIPEDFEVVSKDKDRGTVSLSKDTLKFKLGSVPGETEGQVRFIIKAEDDDVCGQITELTAVISSDDEEEDSSTQLFWVYESGDKGTFNAFITGYTDGTFRPDNAITREEVATMFARAFGYKVYSTVKSFSDMPVTRWSHNYVTACANKNVITGYTDGTFRPMQNITRAELYCMTYKALALDASQKALYVPKEYKKDDSWERDYIANLVRLGMLEDMEDTDANEFATRAEVVYLINRVQFRNPSTRVTGIYSDVYSHWAAKDIESASTTYTYKRTSAGKEKVQ